MPVRKSRRLMGEAPELVPDEFYMRESKPYIPPKPEKEQLLEIEGTISYDGNFDATELAREGDISSFFDTLKQQDEEKGDTKQGRSAPYALCVGCVDVGAWTSHVQFSGAKKVVPERIYSMCIHPRSDHLMVTSSALRDS